MKNRCNNYLNTYNSQYDNSVIEIYSLSNGQNVMYIYFFNNANITSAIYSSARSWRIEGTGIFRCGPTDNTTTNINSYVSANTRGQYFMISNSVKSITNAPIQSSNVMTFLPVTYFTFNYISSLQDIIVEDFNTMKIINKNFNITNYVAEFGQYINLDTTRVKPEYIVYKYEKPQNYFEPLIGYDYNSYQEISDDLGRIFLTQQMLIPNTIIDIRLTPIDKEEFNTLAILFYITDENTVITNGELDENNTFDDDYYNRYNNILNRLISDDIGSITSSSGDITGYIDYSPLTDDSKVDVILNDLPSTSGDMASEMGYSLLENPFTTFLYNIIEGITNTLLDHKKVTLSFDFRGTTYYMDSDDIYIPNGLLKGLVTTLLVFLYVFISYKYYNHLISSLQKADISLLKKELGSDEFMDTNTM